MSVERMVGRLRLLDEDAIADALEELQERLRTADEKYLKLLDDHVSLDFDNRKLRQQIEASQKQQEIGYCSFTYIEDGQTVHHLNITGRLEKGDKLYASPVVPPVPQEISNSTFGLWWAMLEAEHELAEQPISDDATILHYMGCGASCQVSAGDIRKLLGRTKPKSEVKPSC